MKRNYLMGVVSAMLLAGCRSQEATMEYAEVIDSLQQNTRNTGISEEMYSGIYIKNIETAQGRVDFADNAGIIQIQADGSVLMSGVKRMSASGAGNRSVSCSSYEKADSAMSESNVKTGQTTKVEMIEPVRSEGRVKVFLSAMAIAVAIIMMLMVWRKLKG